MKIKSAKKILSYFTTCVLLAQVINISIDPMDPVSDKLGRLAVHEDLTVNEIESIYELVSEQCMGIDVPEHDDNDQDQGSFVKVMAFFFINNSIKIKKQFQDIDTSFFVSDETLPSVDIELISPPPKLG